MGLSKILAAFCLCFLLNTIGYATNSFLVAGSVTINDKTQPLIVTGSDSTTWSAEQLINLPSEFSDWHLSSSFCQDEECYMAGFGDLWPILLKTNQQHEVSVINAINGLPQNMTRGSFKKINCSSNTCIAVGHYYTGSLDLPIGLRKYLPLIVASDDHGKSWSVRPISGLPENLDDTALNEVKCTEASCIVAGSISLYTPDKAPAYISIPMFLLSYDKGQSWIYSQQTFNLKKTVISTSIKEITCRAGFCIAVGDYEDIIGHWPRPLLLTSQDNGNTWAIDESLLKHFQSWGQLLGVSCIDDTTCIAAGVYVGRDWSNLILVSHDSGKTWALPGNNTTYIAVSNLSCTNSFCVIAGFSPSITDVALLVSHDGGDNWVYKQVKQNCLRDYQGNGRSNSLACHDAECVLAGHYFSLNKVKPLLVESHDSGETWSCVSNIANYPSDLAEGYLTTAFAR